MDISVYGVINNVENKNGVAELQKIQHTSLTNMMKSYNACNYMLKEYEEEYLNNILSPSKIIYTKAPQRHSHGAAAFLNHIAYQDVHEEAARFTNVIDVGGSPFRTLPNHHMCVKIDDARTDSRYVNAAFSQLNAVNIKYDFRRYLTNAHNYCIDGAENCLYKADYGFAVNVYDMSFETIVRIMLNHGLLIFDMWMFMPYLLLDPTISTDQIIYKAKIAGDNVEFHLMDESTMYIHNYNQWRAYYTTTMILTNHYAFAIEIVKTYGTFTKFRFTRVDIKTGVMKRCIPLSKRLDVVKVPNMILYHNKGHDATLSWSKNVIVVEKKYVKNCISWLTSCSDQQFNYTAFSTYANSIKNSIRYNQSSAVEMVYKGVDIEINEFEDYKQSVFVIGAIMRFKRTQNIGGIMRYMHDNQPDLSGTNIMLAMKFAIRDILYTISDAFINLFKLMLQKDIHIDAIIHENFIFNARVLEYEDMYFSDMCNLQDSKFLKEFKFPCNRKTYSLNDIRPNKFAWQPRGPTLDELYDGKDKQQAFDDNAVPSEPVNPTAPPQPPTNPDVKPPPSGNGNNTPPNTPEVQKESKEVKRPKTIIDDFISDYIKATKNAVREPPVGGIKYAYKEGEKLKPNNPRVFKFAQQPDLGSNESLNQNVHFIEDGSTDYHIATVQFDPSPHEFKCGSNLITHIFGSEIVDPKEQVWMTEDQMNKYISRIANLIVHIRGTPYKYYDNGKERNISISNNDSHWVLLNCNCPHMHVNILKRDIVIRPTDFIFLFEGDLDLMRLTTDQYNLNKIIPGYYHNQVERKLVNTINSIELTGPKGKKFNVDTLFMLTAGDHAKLHTDFAHALTMIRDHVKDRYVNLIVRYTRIPNFTLACFKSLMEYTNCQVTFIHSNEKGEEYYWKAKPCPSAGYKDLNGDYNVIFTKGDYNNKAWAEIPQNVKNVKGNRMDIKFNDMMHYTHLKMSLLSFDNYIDLSCAPGYFARNMDTFRHKHAGKIKAKMCVINCQYIGKLACPIDKRIFNEKGLKVHYTYNNADQLITQLSKAKIIEETNLLVYDNFITQNQKLLSLIKGNTAMLTKISSDPLCQDLLVDFTNTHKDYHMHYFLNDGSNLDSSEIFVLIYNKTNNIVKQPHLDIDIKVPVGTFVERVDKLNLESVNEITHICKCKLHEQFEGWNDYYIVLDETKFKDYYKKYDKHKLLNPPTHVNIKVIDGVAGAQKTLRVKQNSCQTCTLIIAPYRVIKEQSGISYLQTYELAVAQIAKKFYKNIVLDEVFVYNPTYLIMLQAMSPNSTFYGMGDSKQVDNRDYDKNSCITRYVAARYELESKRMMPTVCKLLQKYIPGVCTTNTNDDVSINNDVTSLENIPPTDDDGHPNIIIVGTQEIKNKFAISCKARVATINESQGATMHNVHFYVNDLHKLPTDKIRYVYTAISRAPNKLVIYGDDTDVSETYTILNTAIDRALQAFNMPIVECTQIIQEMPKMKQHYNINSLYGMEVTQPAIEAILSKIYIPKNDVYSPIVEYKTDVLIENKNKQKFKTSMTAAAGGDVHISGKRFGVRSYQKIYHGKCTKQTLDCMLHRYTKRKDPIPSSYAKKMVDGFNKFMKPGWQKNMRKQITVEEINLSITEYIKELQKKCNGTLFETVINEYESSMRKEGVWAKTDDPMDFKEMADMSNSREQFKTKTQNIVKYFIALMTGGKPNKLTDLEKEWYEAYHDIVSFHLKRQPKDVRDANYDAEFKAGQGVAAWSKIMNVIFSGFTRTFTRLVGQYLLPNVQWAFGQSDAEIGEFFTKYGEQQNSTAFKKFMADFVQFDTSQEEKCVIASMMILVCCGFSEDLLAFYKEKREEWTMMNHGEGFGLPILILLSGEWNQHSGQTFTLSGNTMHNQGAIGMCYDFKDLVCASFKGDDLFAIARDINESKVGAQAIKDICGYQIKAYFVRYPEYIANIIVPYRGFFPDVVRRTSRILSKIYTCQDDWNEIRKSTADALDVIKNDEFLYDGAEYATKFYSQFNIHITPEDVIMLIKFMMQLTKYDDIDSIPTQTFTICDVSQLMN